MTDDLGKNLKKLRRCLVGGPVSRLIDFLTHKGLESFALNQKIPRKIKKSLADSVSDYEIAKLERIKSVNPLLAGFYFLSRPVSVPVHMHHQEWNGIQYRVWEEKSKLSEDSSFTVFFPDLIFPNFSEHVALSPELDVGEEEEDFYNSDRSQLDSQFEFDVWQNVLYQSPVFRDLSSHDRPGLSDSGDFDSIPYKGVPENIRVPFFRTKSLICANAEARAIVEVYQKHQKPIEKIVELLKTKPETRKELINVVGQLETEQFLRRYGLDIDTLPNVVNETEETYQDVNYITYEAIGGSFSGANKVWYWGFINGIQFPNFREDFKLSKYEREITHDVLKLAFDYALYTDPFFEPGSTPRLVSGYSRYDEEAQIAGLNIPKGKAIPFVKNPSIEHVRENIQTSIRAYNAYRYQIEGIVEKLNDKKIQNKLKGILRGHQVHNLSDSVAQFFGEQGARFMVENPYHLERQKAQE